MRNNSSSLPFLPKDLFIVIDKDGIIVEISQAFEVVLGWTKEEFISKKYTEFLHEEDIEKSNSAVEQHRKTGKNLPYFENRYRHKNGGYVWFQWEGSVTKDGMIYGLARDITPLKEKEFYFEEMQKIAKIGCWKLNSETGETHFSSETYRIHELEEGEEQKLEDAIQFYPKDVQGFLLEKVKNLIEKKEPYDMELPFITAKGNHKVVRTNGRCIEKGGLKEVYGLIQDVTEKSLIEKRIELSKLAAGLGFWDWDVSTNELNWDDSLKNIFGIPQTEKVTFETWKARIHPDDLERTVERAKMRAGSRETGMMEFFFRIIRPDGKVRHLKNISVAEIDDQGRITHVMGFDIDITEQVLKQEELEIQRTKNINNSKLALLGEMAANIAHEINNPLSLVMGRAEYLRTKIQNGNFNEEEVLQGLDQIQKVSNRIAKIIKSHKTFSKIDPQTSFVNASLKDLLDDAIEVCATRLKAGSCKLTIDPIPNINIRSRGSELSQVFLNLIGNSIDAIKDQDDKWIKISFKESNGTIFIEFTDSGLGISEDLQEKIMQPFFTTKGKQGTGLGLSIANNCPS